MDAAIVFNKVNMLAASFSFYNNFLTNFSSRRLPLTKTVPAHYAASNLLFVSILRFASVSCGASCDAMCVHDTNDGATAFRQRQKNQNNYYSFSFC